MGHAFQGEQAFKHTAASRRAKELHLRAYQESNYLEEPSTYIRFLTGRRDIVLYNHYILRGRGTQFCIHAFHTHSSHFVKRFCGN